MVYKQTLQKRENKLYLRLCRSFDTAMQLANNPSTKATNGTIDIAIYTKELWQSYSDNAPISRNAPFLLLQSIAVHQAIKLYPSRGAPNDVDVLSRSRRSICYAHVMIAVATRFDSD